MMKCRSYPIVLFAFSILLHFSSMTFADTHQTTSPIQVNYLQWQSDKIFPHIHPQLLVLNKEVPNIEFIKNHINQLTISTNYQGIIALPRQSDKDDDRYIVIMGDGYHLLNTYPEVNSIPLVIEQKTSNSALQAFIDRLPFPDSYRGFLHLPPQNNVSSDSYIVIEGDNYYLITQLLIKKHLPALLVEQKTDNPYLQQYINNLPTPASYQGFMHLPKKDRVFDSYIVLEGSNHHLVNILEDGTLFIQPNIAKHWSQDEQEKDNHWTIYTIDESLNLKVTEAIIHYSQLQKKFLITRKINEQRYRVNDVGTVVKISDKSFPNVVTKYDPTNPQNCLDLSLFFGTDVSEDRTLPLPISRYHVFNPDIVDELFEPEGLGFELDTCRDEIVNRLIPLPRRYSNNVVLYFAGFTEYLVTFNKNGQRLDIMTIRYRDDDNQQYIDYTINHDYSIDLTMTDPDGKVIEQTFDINPQGEFE